MGIKGLDHVNINTSNMKDTMSFYTDLLDFPRWIPSSF